MHAVVVIESCFGNTSKVAEAIIDGLRSSRSRGGGLRGRLGAAPAVR